VVAQDEGKPYEAVWTLNRRTVPDGAGINSANCESDDFQKLIMRGKIDARNVTRAIVEAEKSAAPMH
jgi:hypothetical protein